MTGGGVMKIAIVEDTLMHVETLENYISKFQREEGGAFQVFTYSDGLKFLDSYKSGFDIIFMDINMPYIDGLETAKRLREMDKYTCLIFITEHSSYAVKGYEVAAFDFIVKPVEYEKFRAKFMNAIEAVRKNDRGKICIKNKDFIRMIKVADIIYVASEGHKLIYHLAGEEVETWDTLDAVEGKLPPELFARCGKSFLVNLSAVVTVKGNELTLSNSEILQISRLKKKEFIESLARFSML